MQVIEPHMTIPIKTFIKLKMDNKQKQEKVLSLEKEREREYIEMIDYIHMWRETWADSITRTLKLCTKYILSLIIMEQFYSH